MGGVEDEEPASKRMKLASGELKSLSNGKSLADSPVAGSSGDHRLMARPIQQSSSSPSSSSSSSPSSSSKDGELVGSKGVIKRVEFVRIIAKALYSLGYNKSGARLEEESGISLHSDTVNLFTQQVLAGDWAECLTTLREIASLEESTVKSASFMVLERKFFELLDGDRVADALKTLRAEIAPLGINASRVRQLSSCLVAPSLFGGSVTRVETREELLRQLQELLPPMVMVPEKRLEHLVEQALVLQRDACYFHNSLSEDMSLYTDHHCGKDKIPSKTSQVLHEHCNEVWYVQFSHNGKYLASSSNDGTAIIWEVDENEVKLKHRLFGHQRPVSLLSWSPDDSQLLSCGVEESVRRWDVSSGQCLHIYGKPGLGLVSCGWFPDGKSIFSGVNDKSICMWELGGKEIECWKGQRTLRISDLEITRDGKHVISISRESAILLLDREAKAERLIEEDQTITSFSLSEDNDFLLVNLLNQEIHLWSISGEAKLVAKYKGHKRSRFVIRSCFGGTEEAFIASGSEDSQVYIWHRGTGELIEALPGHSGAVNCVSWNPANPHMLASASDDRTIRIWGLNGLRSKHNGVVCNGVHHCNGNT